MEINDDKKNLPNKIFRKYLRKQTKEIVIDAIDSIKDQIKYKNLWGYDFYIYTLPFTDLSEERKKIIKNIIT